MSIGIHPRDACTIGNQQFSVRRPIEQSWIGNLRQRRGSAEFFVLFCEDTSPLRVASVWLVFNWTLEALLPSAETVRVA